MTDRPIIFSAPMVRALLDGRKTQTRRILKPKGAARDAGYNYLELNVLVGSLWWWDGIHTLVGASQPFPYHIGDRLWVREAFCPRLGYPAPIAKPHYRADSDRPEWRRLWKPSIHMPRWASRLTLTVTDVRVQRLQEISEADAEAEGVEEVSGNWQDADEPATHPSFQAYGQDACFSGAGAAGLSFMTLWNSIHGPDAWCENPWVVALTFTVQRGNIDGALE